MSKPVTMQADWVDQDAEEAVGEQVTSRGRHHLQEYVDKKAAENAERRAKYLKDYKGNIPPPEACVNTRVKCFLGTRLYRENFSNVNWKD